MDKVLCKNLPGKKKTIYLRKWGNQLSITVNLQVKERDESIPVKVLIDSGCTSCAIGRKFVRRHELETIWLKRSVCILNVDGSENNGGRITHHFKCDMQMGKVHWESMDFGITNLDNHDIFLGYDWL